MTSITLEPHEAQIVRDHLVRYQFVDTVERLERAINSSEVESFANVAEARHAMHDADAAVSAFGWNPELGPIEIDAGLQGPAVKAAYWHLEAATNRLHDAANRADSIVDIEEILERFDVVSTAMVLLQRLADLEEEGVR